MAVEASVSINVGGFGWDDTVELWVADTLYSLSPKAARKLAKELKEAAKVVESE